LREYGFSVTVTCDECGAKRKFEAATQGMLIVKDGESGYRSVQPEPYAGYLIDLCGECMKGRDFFGIKL
jgi:hypothetical protein